LHVAEFLPVNQTPTNTACHQRACEGFFNLESISKTVFPAALHSLRGEFAPLLGIRGAVMFFVVFAGMSKQFEHP
jgi:hypothetical protein